MASPFGSVIVPLIAPVAVCAFANCGISRKAKEVRHTNEKMYIVRKKLDFTPVLL
jgi:hypothetical protein